MEPLDFELLTKHMNDPSSLTRLLKAHLWLELCVDRALSIHLARPGKLDVARMRFASKVTFCDAVGAFDEHELAALRTVNKVRNRAAHELHAELSATEFQAIEDGVQGFAKHLFDELGMERPPAGELQLHAERFGWVMVMLIHTLETANVRAAWHKENKQAYDTYMLLCAIHDLQGVLDETAKRENRERAGLPPAPGPTRVWKNFPALERLEKEDGRHGTDAKPV